MTSPETAITATVSGLYSVTVASDGASQPSTTTTPITISNSPLTVANVFDPIQFLVSSASALARQAHNPQLLSSNPSVPSSPDAQLSVSNKFAGASNAQPTYSNPPVVPAFLLETERPPRLLSRLGCAEYRPA